MLLAENVDLNQNTRCAMTYGIQSLKFEGTVREMIKMINII